MSETAKNYSGALVTRGPQPPPAEEVTYYYAEQGESTHLRHYWDILRKRSRLCAGVFLAVITLGALFTFSSPILYTAYSVMKIEPQNPTVTGVAGVGEASREQSVEGQYDYYRTQFALLKSEPLGARVIKTLNLEKNPKFTEDPNPSLIGTVSGKIGIAFDKVIGWFAGDDPSRAAGKRPAYELGVAPWLLGRYASFLTVKPVRNTRLVEVEFNTPDPKLSQDLANQHASAFIQMILENRFSLTKEARDFLGARLAELREKVQNAEVKLNKFRQEHGVVSLDKGENIVVDRLVDINKSLTAARTERIQTESLFRMTRDKNTEYLSNVLNSPLIQQIKGSVANLEAERGRLLAIYTGEHPRVQEINQQIAEARRGLRAEVNNIVRGIESNYAAARGREESLEKEANAQQATALNLKAVGVEYAVLNEEVVVNRGLYENVLKRLHETNVANDLAASNMQVVQRAEFPEVPSSPRWTRNMILSSILGLMLAIASAFFLEYMDTTINTPQNVWTAVSLTTLGVVPHLKSLPEKYRTGLLKNREVAAPVASSDPNDSMSRELVMARDQLSITAESYRTIRTALLLSKAEHPPKVILFTSPAPGDGKTLTTVNVGMALAQSGQSVVVVDGDLRKGRCHKLVGVSNDSGLANVIAGQIPLRNAMKRTNVRNFYVLPRGGLPPNPADLLMSRKMQEVLDELKSSFDFVLIDSPPVIAVSDAAVLSAWCDGVLLVFNSQKTTVQTARRAVERLESIQATILGVILNGVDIRRPDYVDYRTYYPTYYASMMEEFQGADQKSHSSGLNGHRDDHVIGDADDLDRIMADLGFEQGRNPTSDPDGRLTVSRDFFGRMATELGDSLGPAASSTVSDEVSALHESMDAFPKARVWELTQRVSERISDPASRQRFLRAMLKEIRPA